MAIETIVEETEEMMMESFEAMERDFATYRTGKASTSLVENLMVSYYGAQTRLREIASISTPESRLIVIQPWDRNAISDIEKAIQTSNIGISPMNDGKIIRLPVPDLSEERRKTLTKQVRTRAEEAKVAIRNSRRQANDEIKKGEKNSDVTEDESRDLHDQVQKLTDDYSKQIDEATETKCAEILQV